MTTTSHDARLPDYGAEVVILAAGLAAAITDYNDGLPAAVPDGELLRPLSVSDDTIVLAAATLVASRSALPLIPPMLDEGSPA